MLVLVLVLMLIAQAVDAGHTQVLVWRLQETEGSFCKGRRGFLFYNKSEVILWIMITMVLINYLILVGNPFPSSDPGAERQLCDGERRR